MRPKLPQLLLPAFVIVVIVAGCGGGDGSSSAEGDGGSTAPAPGPVTTSSLSKAQFIKRASAICVRRREERQKAFDAYVKENSPDGGEASAVVLLEAVKAVLVPTLEAQAAEIRKLGAPRGDERRIEEILVAFESAADAASKLESTEANAAVNQHLNHAGRVARKYGLKECTVG